MTPACCACLHWKHRYDDQYGRGRGTCWHEVPCVMTHEDDDCEAFVDRLANRAEFEASHARAARDARDAYATMLGCLDGKQRTH